MKIALRVLLALAICATPVLAFAQPIPSPVPAVPVTNTSIDFAPIVNPLLQVLSVVITLLVIPLLWAWIAKMLKSCGIEATAELNATRAVVDSIAQKAIGGAITRLNVKPGQITLDVKNDLIAEAANSLVANAGDSLGKLGVKDNDKFLKAREVIESRLGLMEAAAAGTPVPNPSHPPTPVVAGVPIEGAFLK